MNLVRTFVYPTYYKRPNIVNIYINILNYNSSIDLPGRSILEQLILRIAPTAGQYGKILPSRLSNIGSLKFNIIMFSN